MKRSSRILKILVFVLLLIAGALYAVGKTCGELEYQTKVEMEAPLGFSWSVFQDPSHMRNWIRGFQRIEMVEGVIGQPGSQYNIILEENGHQFTIEQTIVILSPPDLMKYDIVNDYITGTTNIEFSSDLQRTSVVVTTKVKGQNAFKNLLVHWEKDGLTDQDQDNWSKLKQLVEAKYARH
ncbi:MAG: hypothetical protein ACI84C_000968 [Flavobacteriales bacterium]|jgi:hypothetical protein